MKQLLRMTLFGFVLSLVTVAVAAEQTITLTVDGMTCSMCPKMVQEAINAVSGVKQCTASYEDKVGTAVVTFEDSVASIDTIVAASAEIGYPAQLAIQ